MRELKIQLATRDLIGLRPSTTTALIGSNRETSRLTGDDDVATRR